MKTVSKFALCVIALSSASAFADITINITGSTAFRGASHNAILAAMTTPQYAYNAGPAGTGTLSGASQAIFVGTVAGIEGTTTVRTSWSGSAEGIAKVIDGNVNFLSTSTPRSANGTPVTVAGTDSASPRFAFSDVEQASTPIKTPILTATRAGVVPFVWVTNPTGNALGVTNVTPQSVEALFGGGLQPLSLFTGVTADATKFAAAVGRTTSSGTRITALAEAGYGINTDVLQFGTPTYTTVGSQRTISAFGSVDNNGFASSGEVATAMSATSENVDVFGDVLQLALISYVGTGDANTIVTAGGKTLTYNGVPYSLENVRNGSYTFWGYQYLLHPVSLGADEMTFKAAVLSKLPANLGSSGIAESTLNVVRTGGDGGLVGPRN